jgi:hypothetical protein
MSLEKVKEGMAKVLHSMNSCRMSQYDNGASSEGDDHRFDVAAHGAILNVRETLGYIRYQDGQLLTDEVELDPVRIDPTKLEVLAESQPYADKGGGLFLNGKDALMATQHFACLFPMGIPVIRELGKGQWIRVNQSVARAMGQLCAVSRIAGRALTITAGSMDGGETLMLDISMGRLGEEDHFHARLEQPIIFAPWIDFERAMRRFMTPPSVMAMTPLRSINAALNKSIAMAKRQRGDTSALVSELVFEDGELSVRPVPTVSGGFYAGGGEPLPVKLVGYSGSSGYHSQFFRTGLLKQAFEIYGDGIDTATLHIGARPGDPIVLMHEDTFFAVGTAGVVVESEEANNEQEEEV